MLAGPQTAAMVLLVWWIPPPSPSELQLKAVQARDGCMIELLGLAVAPPYYMLFAACHGRVTSSAPDKPVL